MSPSVRASVNQSASQTVRQSVGGSVSLFAMFVAKSVSRLVGESPVIIGNHTVFLFQFGINLHLRVFQRSEIARAASVDNINMKECAWRKCQKMFLRLFSHYRKHF